MLCHCVPALFIVPATGTPPDSADTRVSLPLAAVTVMPWPGWTALLPLPGVMLSQAAAAAAADARAAGPPDAPAVPAPPEPPEQAAASRPATAQTAMMMLRAVPGPAVRSVERLLGVGFLGTSDLSVRGAACV